MDTLEAVQILREVMLGEKPAATQPQRVQKARPTTTQPQRVEEVAPRKAAPTTRTWHRLDRNAKAFLTTKTGGPLWSKVTRRVTLSLATGDVIEDLQVNESTSDKLLHRPLPAGTPGTCTILYHVDNSVANMLAPTIQPQRVGTKLDSESEAPEPNYVSDDKGDERPTRHRRNPCLNKYVEDKRPDRSNNVPHRIVALVAAETDEVPRLVIKQHKLARGYGAAKLELQLKEWGYESHSKRAEAKNFAGVIVCPTTGKILEYRDLINVPELPQMWIRLLANELGRLTQGIRKIKRTNTIYFIDKSEIPKDELKQVMYARIVVDHKPHKPEENRTRVTVGGDRIHCDYDISAPTCSLPTIKLFWNYVLSMPGGKYFTMDISNFYVGLPLDKLEYMRMPMRLMPEEIVENTISKSLSTMAGCTSK